MTSQNSIKMILKSGEVVIKLFDDIAPNHTARLKEFVNSGFYNGLGFHRVIEGFIAQAGCPNGDGTSRSGTSIKGEFSDIPFTRGKVGMARGFDKDSADCQFFSVLQDSPRLKGQYTIWGEVISGMEYIDALTKGKGEKPEKIVKMEVI